MKKPLYSDGKFSTEWTAIVDVFIKVMRLLLSWDVSDHSSCSIRAVFAFYARRERRQQVYGSSAAMRKKCRGL